MWIQVASAFAPRVVRSLRGREGAHLLYTYMTDGPQMIQIASVGTILDTLGHKAA